MQVDEQAGNQVRVHGRWPPGVSGNPGGRTGRAAHRARIEAIIAAWVAPAGGVNRFNAAELSLLHTAAELTLTRSRIAEDKVRAANTVEKILRRCGLVGRGRAKPPSFHDIMRSRHEGDR
jgi:hypothetical protein